jgi:hypothetical protein
MRARALFLLVTFSLISSGSVVAKSPVSSGHVMKSDDDSLAAHLIAIERESWVAWQHHDATFFQNFLSDDHVEVGTNGIATKAQVVAFVGSGACIVNSYAVDHFQATRFDDNTALLTYRAAQNTMCGKSQVPSPTWVSSLFVRRNGKWVNALYQHTKAE